MSNKTTIITVPSHYGCSRQGTQFAPQELLSSVAIQGADIRSVQLLQEDLKNTEMTDGIKNLHQVRKINIQLRDCLQSVGYASKILVLGGDHSIAIGSISGALMQDNNLGVIWFDAHGDINTEQTSPTGNAHGMPVAALMGLCQSSINDIAPIRLKKENIFWIGARDLDQGEIDTLKQLGIFENVYSSDYIHQVGMSNVMNEVKTKIADRNILSMHLSFDIDGMDPTIVSSTGTPVPNGLKQDDFTQFAQSLHDLPIIRTMDFVEYNPLIGDRTSTITWCQQSLRTLLHSVSFIA